MMRGPVSGYVALVATILLAGAPSVAEGQVKASIDAGGASVRYADTLSLTAATVAPAIHFDAGALRGGAAGVLSSLGDGSRSMQGSLALSALSAAFGPLRGEVAGNAGGTTHQDGARTGQYLGRGRLHLTSGARGLWAGAATGQTWDGAKWHAVVEGDLGAWARMGGVSILGTLVPASIGDSIRYTDAQGILGWSGRRAELQASAGVRNGEDLIESSSRTWGSVSATMWILPQVALVAAGGSYPTDFTQGFPGARYASVALRFAAQPRPAFNRSVAVEGRGKRQGTAASPGFETRALPDGRHSLRVHAPAARRVELMGDFTGWQPVALTPAGDGWWALAQPVARGSYQLNVRIDGAAWRVPPGVTGTVDEYGARVGLVHLR